MTHNNDVITKLYGACFCCFHGKKEDLYAKTARI